MWDMPDRSLFLLLLKETDMQLELFEFVVWDTGYGIICWYVYLNGVWDVWGIKR